MGRAAGRRRITKTSGNVCCRRNCRGEIFRGSRRSEDPIGRVRLRVRYWVRVRFASKRTVIGLSQTPLFSTRIAERTQSWYPGFRTVTS